MKTDPRPLIMAAEAALSAVQYARSVDYELSEVTMDGHMECAMCGAEEYTPHTAECPIGDIIPRLRAYLEEA